MQPLMKALAWTFAHSLWQGLLAALLAAVIISATRKTTARLRYNLLGMVFMCFLAVVLINFFVQLRGAQQKEGITSPALATVTLTADGSASAISASAPLSAGFLTTISDWFDRNADLLLLTWSLFFLVNCLKLFTGLAAVNRLRHYKTHPVPGEWKIKLEKWREILGIRRSISLLQSELVKVPVALGFLKPVILLPVGLLANIPPEQVEAILLHELGHIRRRDYLVNFLQHLAEAIFFFNPAVLWMSSLLRQEREACCDDIVVARTGQKRNYLNALVRFQEYSLIHSSHVMGISNRRQYLLNRVKRMITNENKKLNLLEKAALLAGILLFSAFSFIKNEKQITKVRETLPAGQFIKLQESKDTLIEKIARKTENRSIKKEKKNINRAYKLVTDTVPGKSDKTPPPKKDWEKTSPGDPERVLQEIQQLKDQIGVKKESIGEKKKELEAKQGKNAEEEQALKIQIEKERSEIEGKRAELENKRVILDKIKKQKVIENEKKNEIKNEEKSERKPEIKYEKQEDKIAGTKETVNKDEIGSSRKNLFQRKITTRPRKLFAYSRTIEFKQVEWKEVKFDLHVQPNKTGPTITTPPEQPDGRSTPKSPVPAKLKTVPARKVQI